jgi:hypothetical protein
MDAARRQELRLYKPWNQRHKGRGARFNRGGGHQVNTGPELRSHARRREELLLRACTYSASLERPPTITATIAPGMEASIVDNPGVMDSGANISITNPTVVAHLHLLPQKYEKSFHITFGNGSTYKCTHYAYFGPILGSCDRP